MFGRSEKQTATPTIEKVGGKGRPTPTRKDAQAAAKQRARQGMDKKASKKVQRERQQDSNAKMRAGMKAGDERYLMDRDKGPVRRFVRDYVDVRISFMQYLLPVLVVIMVMQLSQVPSLVGASQTLWAVSIVLLLADALMLILRLSRELRTRFPDGETKGWHFYAFMRAIQIRPLRLPKPRLKMREKLPERY